LADELVIAIALILVIEGGLYALFPEGMKKMMVTVLAIPVSTLRSVGLFVATVGVAIIWLLKN
jgi:uncharacterized protein YjeT (DUF2065 family)